MPLPTNETSSCANAWWAHMHHFLSVCLLLDQKSEQTIIHISTSIADGVARYGMNLGDILIDLEGQGHRFKI